ncbi:Thioredoxin-like protein [Lachnellula subtilissima]|uniref:Thioredoxin-like protein n=1 Tax=Lachnellula subtilissima TaxID=602034 RepID=A0A8H8U6Q1_9HELO|nr:Thioredoxin-like protein [Lachnellula subtilissima]
MSPTVSIGSSGQFSKLLGTSNVVITDFYADWCGPCKTISPVFESLSTKYSKPNRITFTKVNVDNQQEIAQQYGVSAMPTFLIFRNGSVINTIKGADTRGLTTAIENAVKLAGPIAPPVFSTQGRTLGGAPSRSTSLRRPFDWKRYVDAIAAFLGLYLVSLFSFDAYKAAEDSYFNIYRDPRLAGSASGTSRNVPGGKVDKRASAATSVGKKLGTIADLGGD